MARREEWQEQVKLSSLLDKWLDPTCTFATATDPVASSATAGAMRKKRGVKAGLPDTLVLHRGKLVTLELKSRQGKCSASQRSGVSARQISPRPCVAIKLIASGVMHWAAIVRSPSFSRSSSSTTTSILPARKSSRASGIVAKDMRRLPG